MFDLTFLGTSASVPSADRNHPGLLVSTGNTRILVDCGEGTQRQLLRSGAGFRRLRRLLLHMGISTTYWESRNSVHDGHSKAWKSWSSMVDHIHCRSLPRAGGLWAKDKHRFRSSLL